MKLLSLFGIFAKRKSIVQEIEEQRQDYLSRVGELSAHEFDHLHSMICIECDSDLPGIPYDAGRHAQKAIVGLVSATIGDKQENLERAKMVTRALVRTNGITLAGLYFAAESCKTLIESGHLDGAAAILEEAIKHGNEDDRTPINEVYDALEAKGFKGAQNKVTVRADRAAQTEAPAPAPAPAPAQ